MTTAGPQDDRTGVWSGAPVRPADLKPVVGLAIALLAVPLMLVGTLLFALLPGPFTWWLGAIVGLAVAVGLVLYRLMRADEVVRSAVEGTLPQGEPTPRLTNMVEGLTLAGGVVPPSVTVLEDPARNAMAIRRQDRNHLILTRGLLDSMEVVELEGTVAELLSRLRNGDAEAATVGAAIFGLPVLDGPLSALLGPTALVALGRLLDRDRDLEADRQAVALTRYPPGLRAALVAISKSEGEPQTTTLGTRHMWLVDPEPQSDSRGTRAPLRLRIDVLSEL